MAENHLTEAQAIIRQAHAAYIKTIRMQTISGETDAERRASQGEARDYAAEVMHGELGGLTFEHLDTIVAALAKPASSPAGGDVREALERILKHHRSYIMELPGAFGVSDIEFADRALSQSTSAGRGE